MFKNRKVKSNQYDDKFYFHSRKWNTNLSFAERYQSDIKDYTDGVEPLTQIEAGKYTKIIIMPRQRSMFLIFNPRKRNDFFLYFSKGFWMDFPEDHWSVSIDEYNTMSEKERSSLEMKEQLTWLQHDIFHHWVSHFTVEKTFCNCLEFTKMYLAVAEEQDQELMNAILGKINESRTKSL